MGELVYLKPKKGSKLAKIVKAANKAVNGSETYEKFMLQLRSYVEDYSATDQAVSEDKNK